MRFLSEVFAPLGFVWWMLGKKLVGIVVFCYPVYGSLLAYYSWLTADSNPKGAAATITTWMILLFYWLFFAFINRKTFYKWAFNENKTKIKNVDKTY